MIDASGSKQFVQVFWTELGWIGVVLGPSGVRMLTFGHTSEEECWNRLDMAEVENSLPSPNWWPDAQKLLVDYAAGLPVNLSKIPVEATRRTEFQQRVVSELQNVPIGETITYRDLADRAGSPGAARAVGNHMAKNRIPLIIPCHRVVGAGGHLGGFSAPQGLDMKRHLLKLERTSAGASDPIERSATYLF